MKNPLKNDVNRRLLEKHGEMLKSLEALIIFIFLALTYVSIGVFLLSSIHGSIAIVWFVIMPLAVLYSWEYRKAKRELIEEAKRKLKQEALGDKIRHSTGYFR